MMLLGTLARALHTRCAVLPDGERIPVQINDRYGATIEGVSYDVKHNRIMLNVGPPLDKLGKDAAIDYANEKKEGKT